MKSRIGPNGVHLFDRVSGLNVLLDELRPKEAIWSTSPRQVSIALTNVCDLHCAYCYAPKHKASLHTDQVLGWLKELDTEGCLGIGFGGGEPTLHPDFVDICKRVAGETQLAVTFTTHGHRLTPQLVEHLKGSVHFARISVDGVGRTYEQQRGKQFASLLRGMESIATLSPFGINVVVNERTVVELDAMSELAQKVGASELLLLPQQATTAVASMDGVVGRALQDWVSSYRGKVRLAVSEAGASGLPTCDPLPDERGLQAYAHIDASGMLRASSYSPAYVKIENSGVLSALKRLRNTFEINRETQS
ncbi:radical SAM protein [Xanthomonas hortorum pv. vitians]|uniref:radical SAM protein n=1 Tax=Xanthomonas TaxID=338 RepID=UPI000538F782|nr:MULTISPECIES: radical SAM protein [Xanthomonas]ASW45335.1 radical SAM protein [Xanthomonas hortorum]KGU38896.1 radical SAM protein [Xanthomonas phaseoli pv. phaseoli]KGU40280.1 radical SAM protein [Xanthomonas citri pv. fuscans]MCE4280329.1 radical SAM protein [Xanthomonas hortorum pv. vitians]MCE4337721.1 radical SAM protein [Xanthomonas hortorum pv. vitians]